MSVVPEVSIPYEIVRELADATAVYAPAESTALRDLLERPEATPSAVLSALVALSLPLLEAGTVEATELWEDLLAVVQSMRGALIEQADAAPEATQRRLIAYLRDLAATGAPAYAALPAILAPSELVVAAAGDFKRGKSTLLNALLGRRLLPTRVAPATAVPCLIHEASAPAATVFYDDGREPVTIAVDDLARYACIPLPGEDGLAYRAGIARVEIGVPWTLPPETILIDLPGLNEEAGRAAVARAMLAGADVLLVVFSATQPLAENELQLVETLWAEGYRALIFVLNHRDHLEPAEQETVEERASLLLAPYGGVLGVNTFLVSARAALLARERGEPPPPESGMPALEACLSTLLTTRRGRLWQLSHLRQAMASLTDAYEEAGRRILELQAEARDREADLARVEATLEATRRRQARREDAALDELTLTRQQLLAHEQRYDDRWAALEAAWRERARTEPLPWFWQEGREWLRASLIEAIRAANPAVTPRPEAHLRLRQPSGLRLSREALLTFYRAEAEREWERFTGAVRRAERADLAAALAALEEARDLPRADRSGEIALEARRDALAAERDAAMAAARTALPVALDAAAALRTALAWPAPRG